MDKDALHGNGDDDVFHAVTWHRGAFNREHEVWQLDCTTGDQEPNPENEYPCGRTRIVTTEAEAHLKLSWHQTCSP